MYCIKCGKEVEGNKKYCPDCNPNKTNSDDQLFGILSLVLGLCGLFFGIGIVGGILAVIFGEKSINTSGSEYGKYGKVLGIIILSFYGFSIPFVIIGLVYSLTFGFLGTIINFVITILSAILGLIVI